MTPGVLTQKLLESVSPGQPALGSVPGVHDDQNTLPNSAHYCTQLFPCWTSLYPTTQSDVGGILPHSTGNGAGVHGLTLEDRFRNRKEKEVGVVASHLSSQNLGG